MPTTTDTAASAEATETDPVEGSVDATTEESVEGSEALGDAGKKALDAMKAERNAARKDAADARAERDRLKAEAEGRQAEFEAEQKAREVEATALAKANDRILKAEIRAAAASKLADPNDALLHIDTSQFEVGADGEVDGTAIAEAIAALVVAKPYLAAQSGARFNGSADQGARNATAKTQVTRDQLKDMTDAEIAAAKSEGRLDTLLGRK